MAANSVCSMASLAVAVCFVMMGGAAGGKILSNNSSNNENRC